MSITIETVTDGSITVTLDDTEDWDEFAAANAEEIAERYGARHNAYRHLCNGGLMLGGGAGPAVSVYFKD